MSFEDAVHELGAQVNHSARLLAGTLLQEAHTAGKVAAEAAWRAQCEFLQDPARRGEHPAVSELRAQQLMAEAVRKGTLIGVLRYLGTLQSNNSHVDDETYVPFGEMAGLIESGEIE